MMGNAMYRKQVTNKEYQSWTGYPDSPYLYSVFPYQTILDTYGLINLIVSVRPFYRDGSLVVDGDIFEGVYYDDVTHAWGTATDHYSARNANSIIESNHDIYTDATLTSVDFSKTTTPEQDGGSATSLIRIRNLHHKDGASLIRDKAAFWLERSANLNYQKWTGYPDSPYLSSLCRYQAIIFDGADTYLAMGYSTTGPIHSEGTYISSTDSTMRDYKLVGGAWVLWDSNVAGVYYASILQSNCDIYQRPSNILEFFKTTTPSQDAGITLHRINI